MSDSTTRSELGQVLDAIKSMQTDMKVMQADIQAIDKKLDIHIVRTEEQFNMVRAEIQSVRTELKTEIHAANNKLDELTKRQNATDGRLWAFLVAMFFTVVGLLAKITLFDRA